MIDQARSVEFPDLAPEFRRALDWQQESEVLLKQIQEHSEESPAFCFLNGLRLDIMCHQTRCAPLNERVIWRQSVDSKERALYHGGADSNAFGSGIDVRISGLEYPLDEAV